MLDQIIYVKLEYNRNFSATSNVEDPVIIRVVILENNIICLHEMNFKEARAIWNKVIRCEKYFFQTLSGQYLID